MRRSRGEVAANPAPSPPDKGGRPDVFISYAAADRLAAEKLAAYLEGLGWLVWMDRRLHAGEAYRDVIQEKLSAARCVVVLWTETSVASEWVRAEARGARASGKLVPAKSAGFAIDKIPMPFGEMHIETVDRPDAVAAAVARQVARPAPEVLTFGAFASQMRFSLLTWLGIIGTTLTVLTGFKGLWDLAKWMQVLVDHWHEWTYAAWAWVLSMFGLAIPRPLAAGASFLVFALMVGFGARRETGLVSASASSAPNWHSEKRQGLFLTLSCMMLFFALLGVVAAAVEATGGFGTFSVFGPVLLLFSLIGVLLSLLWSSRRMMDAVALMLLVAPMLFSMTYQPAQRWFEDRRRSELEMRALHAKLKQKLTREELTDVGLQLSRMKKDASAQMLGEQFSSLQKRLESLQGTVRRECTFIFWGCLERTQSVGNLLDKSNADTLGLSWGGGALLAFQSVYLFIYILFVAIVPHAAPLSLINRRLLTSLIGVVLIVGLSEASKLAPKLLALVSA